MEPISLSGKTFCSNCGMTIYERPDFKTTPSIIKNEPPKIKDLHTEITDSNFDGILNENKTANAINQGAVQDSVPPITPIATPIIKNADNSTTDTLGNILPAPTIPPTQPQAPSPPDTFVNSSAISSNGVSSFVATTSPKEEKIEPTSVSQPKNISSPSIGVVSPLPTKITGDSKNEGEPLPVQNITTPKGNLLRDKINKTIVPTVPEIPLSQPIPKKALPQNPTIIPTTPSLEINKTQEPAPVTAENGLAQKEKADIPSKTILSKTATEPLAPTDNIEPMGKDKLDAEDTPTVLSGQEKPKLVIRDNGHLGTRGEHRLSQTLRLNTAKQPENEKPQKEKADEQLDNFVEKKGKEFDEQVKNLDTLGASGILLDILDDKAVEKEDEQKMVSFHAAADVVDDIRVLGPEPKKSRKIRHHREKPRLKDQMLSKKGEASSEKKPEQPLIPDTKFDLYGNPMPQPLQPEEIEKMLSRQNSAKITDKKGLEEEKKPKLPASSTTTTSGMMTEMPVIDPEKRKTSALSGYFKDIFNK